MTGGFALAASWVWGDEHNIVSFCEIDPFCQKVLKKHWPGVPIQYDIKEYKHDGTNVDLLTGGPPCQATSVAAAIQGCRTNKTLYPEMDRIIRLVRPKWVIVEQPAGNKNWEDSVKVSLESAGYTVDKFKRQVSDIGGYHGRRRVFFVANATCKRLKQVARFGRSSKAKAVAWPVPPRGAWRSTRTGNCGMDDGIPDWVDRLKSLGNAIVPQCVQPIMQAIKDINENIVAS